MLIDLDLVRARAKIRIGNVTIISVRDMALVQYHEWMNRMVSDAKWAMEQVKRYGY